MKHKIVLIILFGLLIGGIVIGRGIDRDDSSDTSSITDTSSANKSEPVLGTETRSLPATPRVLRIPKLDVEADVEVVGLDAEKRMDVPKKDMNVAWYRLGPQPGDPGSAVLAGHFDARTGGPAVFYELGRVQKGDEVVVVDERGIERTFRVVDTAKYKDADFPIEKVFSGSKDKARLNLITCSGVFDQQAQNYSDRLVVFTELVE